MFGISPLRLFGIGQLLVILALVGFNAWQRSTINDLEAWRDGVTGALSHAVDQRDQAGRLLPVKPGDAATHILALGRFRTDAIAAQAEAAASDGAHVITVAGRDAAINRKASDDHEDRIAAARADADALRVALAARRAPHGAADAGPDRLRVPDGRAAGDQGLGAATPVPAVSAAGGEPYAPPGPDGLPASGGAVCTEMSIAERLLATEQAIQLDDLVSAIEDLAGVQR